MDIILSVGLFGIIALFGLFLLIQSIKNSQRIFYGQELSKAYLIKTAFLAGLSTSMLFLTLIFFVSLFEGDSRWSIEWVLIFIVLAIFGGLLVFLGACVHYSAVNKYRETVFKKTIERIMRDKEK
ncbi:MAG: hypothetical protein ACKOC5_11615 [Chloroflexota bacterium]